MNKVAKQESVAKMRSLFESSEVIILAHNKGLTVSAANNVRKNIRQETGGIYFIAKNTLMKLAVKGTRYEQLSASFSGPVAVVCGQDSVTMSKTLVKFCKENEKLVIIGGSVAGDKLEVGEINTLATLPTFDEVRARLLSVLQAPGARIARLLSAYADKQ